MTELLDQAIRLLEKLPASDQDAAAGALLDYLDHRDATRLTEAQIAEVTRRLNDPKLVLISAEEARERILGSGS